MADVFISYSREDRPRAEQVARGLEAAGLDAFWDSEIPPGQTWADYIEGKLSVCKVVIVLWSQHSTRSQWVREEARMGRDKGKLIPVMIDGSQAPFGFGEVQTADLSTWNGSTSDVNWQRVVEAVRAAAGAPSAPRPATPPPSTPRHVAAPPPAAAKSGGGIKPIWLWIGGAVAALLVIGVFANQNSAPPQYVDPVVDPLQQAQQPVQQTQQEASQQAYQEQVLQQLGMVQQAQGSEGFGQLGDHTVGALRQGQTFDVPITLSMGYEYRVAGVCDNDCGDLDLVMFDGFGNEIMRDTSANRYPVVGVIPTTPGAFAVQVQMYNCTIEPCYYALALFARPVQ